MEGAIKQSRKPGGEISFKSRHGNGKRLVERGGGKGMGWGGGRGREEEATLGNTQLLDRQVPLVDNTAGA